MATEPMTPAEALGHLIAISENVPMRGTPAALKEGLALLDRSIETLRTFIDEHTPTADAPADAPAVDEGGE